MFATVLVAAAVAAPGAVGATFHVTSTADAVDASPGDGVCAASGGACTLRAAIQEANAHAGYDTVTVPPGTYVLTIPGQGEDAAATGDLDVTDSLSLVGAGARTTILDGGGLDRVLDVWSSATVENVTIRHGNGDYVEPGGETGPTNGSAILVRGGASATVKDSTLTGNTGDAFGNQGGATILRTAITGNSGTGVVEDFGFADVVDSTLDGNGVGIRDGDGGATSVDADTISANGIGIDKDDFSSDSSVARSILALNTANCSIASEGGAIASAGHNLDDGTTCPFTGSGDRSATNPMLGPLASNGGPTRTRALPPASPAVDAAGETGCPVSDQRGTFRPQGAACDIGAYELVQADTASAALSPSFGSGGTATTVTGSGFGSGEPVDVLLDATLAGTTTAGSGGALAPFVLHVPAGAAPGKHRVGVIGETSHRVAGPTFTVISNWSQFRRNPRHRAFADGEHTISVANAPTLFAAWTGPSATNQMDSSPAVANGLVYAGGKDGVLYAFAVGCGTGGVACTPKWTDSGDGAIFSSPAVDGGHVFVGAGEFLDAFPASCHATSHHCALQWHAPFLDLVGSPAVSNGVVYAADQNGNLHAFPESCGAGGATCSPTWVASPGGAIESSPAVSTTTVFVGTDDGVLAAYRVGCATGGHLCHPRWKASLDGEVIASPSLADGMVFVTSANGTLYAFSQTCGSGGATCTPLWTGDMWPGQTAESESSPAVANGMVFATAWHSFDARVFAFTETCGSSTCGPLWSGQIGPNVTHSSPAFANGVVYVGEGHSLFAFDAACGTGGALCSPIAQLGLGAALDSSPAVADGAVYVGADDGAVHAFELP